MALTRTLIASTVGVSVSTSASVSGSSLMVCLHESAHGCGGHIFVAPIRHPGGRNAYYVTLPDYEVHPAEITEFLGNIHHLRVKLHNFLCVLLHQSEEGRLEAAWLDVRDRVGAIASIFQSIKSAEDAVDLSKSKNSHIICDLGLAIIKHLYGNRLDTELPHFIPLSPVLYGLIEKSEGDDSMTNGKFLLPWLARDDLFLHFQSLNLQNGARVESGVIIDRKNLKHKGKDDAELPLMKMMKMLKSNKSKKKNAITAPASCDIKRQDDDLDILSMVKEIESENLSGHKSLGVGEFAATATPPQREEIINNSISDNGPPQSRKTNKETYECDSNHKRKTSDDESLTRIDSSKPKKRQKKELRGTDSLASGNELKDEFSVDKVRVEPTGITSLIEPALETQKSAPSRGKRKSSSTLKDDIYVYGETKHERKENSTLSDEKLFKAKENVGSMKKGKTKGVAALQKCSSKTTEKSDEELIGCRIKVWWPMDKRFYEGVVQSYDVKKKKHTILYDDGDVEVLLLAREKWEMVDDVEETMSKSPQLPGPPTSHEKSSGNRTKKGRASGGKKSTAKKKHKSPNSSVKRKVSKSRVSPPSDEDDASQHSDDEQDESSMNHDDVEGAEVVPPAENVCDEPEIGNKDNILNEDKSNPLSSQSPEDSNVKQKDSDDLEGK